MKTYEKAEFTDFFLQSCESKKEIPEVNNDNISIIGNDIGKMKKSRIHSTVSTTYNVHNDVVHRNQELSEERKNIDIDKYKKIDINKNKNDNENKKDDESKDINISNVKAINNNEAINNDKAYYLFHYPNLCINRYGQWMDTNIVYPLGPDKCIVEFEWYVEEDMIGNIEKEEEKEVVKKNLFIDECINDSEIVQFEDIHLCERVQKGLNSTGYKGREGRYAPNMEAGK